MSENRTLQDSLLLNAIVKASKTGGSKASKTGASYCLYIRNKLSEQ